MTPELQPSSWLLLIHQLPAKPAYLRVKTWRRMQALGAVALKGSVYALPHSDGAQEDLEWVLREIIDGGGEGLICEARLVDGLTNGEVAALFRAARDSDYRALMGEMQAVAQGLARDPGGEPTTTAAQLARLRKRFDQIAAIDFFDAPGRREAEQRLAALDLALRTPLEPAQAASPLSELTGRTWVTRRGVHVDRIACAWLIRRFVDPDARFKFVAPKGYAPEPGELRFDMFEAEFTHEGDRCSFEVLLARRHMADPALQAIGEIIHDIDIKDDKFRREETPGVAHMIAGIAAAHDDDERRIARGSALLDDLYAFFEGRQHAPN